MPSCLAKLFAIPLTESNGDDLPVDLEPFKPKNGKYKDINRKKRKTVFYIYYIYGSKTQVKSEAI